ncbi:MAG: hypothetical protein DWQ47_06570 [Acidobacteria bacterium]|nr:MAG: hypothetical protein DWQ32_10120 [Acidobacteriota bacterium]REK02037.1 MAG: hypothetical protein DWQ38_06550 [Acidobacteriota bacterium]REK14995.1 MAG: hypothetical protein DWQ43_15810 [Acidobacteriota bacterium]REK45709.1 MAG: hypothetical protein DWQ47_06570 [Acidobacteriota bacterium]
MNKNFGKRVENIWKDLRPVTKQMLEGAMRPGKLTKRLKFSYDAHSDWELSSLLNALDEQVKDTSLSEQPKDLRAIRNLADVCAGVLEARTESAEVFIQLTRRALARNDFERVDKLADILFERFTAGETAEVIRQTELAQIRAIAYETLAVLPTTLVVPLLEDPLYFEIACNVLEQQAVEFESEEARLVLEHLGEEMDLEGDIQG